MVNVNQQGFLSLLAIVAAVAVAAVGISFVVFKNNTAAVPEANAADVDAYIKEIESMARQEHAPNSSQAEATSHAGEPASADSRVTGHVEPPMPREYTIDDYVAVDDPLRMEARDLRRKSDLLLKTGIDYYYITNGVYPEDLDELEAANVVKPIFPRDPLDNSHYVYACQSAGKGVHVGANFEWTERSNTGAGYELAADADCNSKNNEDCFRSGAHVGGFDGGDEAGCHGEQGRFCYDIED